ncbi:hypothetical protein MLD38_008060 [Melastoma candidum]|uniref:Uncharacterized protein n=1 Tax=Melastoma candidum TaxID=119954 RepID=A0ACB9RS95_9MYRT|nr:hypothetical protein MLD38_008060 [Melastoma candidum]
MGRSPCCDESGLKKGPWMPEEDQKLVKYIQKHGHGSWRALPKLAGLNRCGKSCRLRWTNYLRPDIKRGKFSAEEEQTILNLHSFLGNKWSAIASHLPGRTDNEIKNFWNTHLKKKLIQMGFDPMTHRPRTDIFSSLPHLLALANLKELLDHNSLEEHAIRLQAEAVTKLQYLQCLLQSPPLAPLAPPTASAVLNPYSDDIETMKLLNSLASMQDNHDQVLGMTSQNFVPNSAANNGTASADMYDSFPFAHLPEMQSPWKFEEQVTPGKHKTKDMITNAVQGDASQDLMISPNSPWQLPPSCSASLSGALADTSVYNPNQDACVSSSYGGEDWPDLQLLEDPMFREIAL